LAINPRFADFKKFLEKTPPPVMKKVVLVIAIAALTGGSNPPFAKVALQVFAPFTLVMIRFFFASLVLIPFIYKKNELNLRSFKNLFWVAAIGAINPILLFIGLQFSKASVAPLIYAAIPMMTAVYLSVARKQKILPAQTLGIIVGFLGVATIIVLPLLDKQNLYLKEFSGNILIFAAAIAFLAYGLLSKYKQQKYAISPIALTFYFALVSFLLSIPFAALEFSKGSNQLASIQLRHILSALEIGIVGTSIFYLAYQYALKLSSELTAALFTYLQPVATIFFAVLLLGEKITTPFLLGGTLAIIGTQIAIGKVSVKRLTNWIRGSE